MKNPGMGKSLLLAALLLVGCGAFGAKATKGKNNPKILPPPPAETSDDTPDNGSRIMTKIKIYQSSRSAPGLSDNLTNIGSAGLRNRWCVFTIEFIPRAPGNDRKLWIDDPTLDVRAVFIGQNKGAQANYIFTGSCKFYTMALDGKRHSVLMMIPPQLLDRYLPAGTGTVGPGTFSVEALFKDRSGAPIGRGFYYGKGVGSEKTAQALFDKLEAVQPQLVIADSIFHHSRTPWMNYRPDDFDLVRSNK